MSGALAGFGPRAGFSPTPGTGGAGWRGLGRPAAISGGGTPRATLSP
jgi:hypothetical protein